MYYIGDSKLPIIPFSDNPEDAYHFLSIDHFVADQRFHFYIEGVPYSSIAQYLESHKFVLDDLTAEYDLGADALAEIFDDEYPNTDTFEDYVYQARSVEEVYERSRQLTDILWKNPDIDFQTKWEEKRLELLERALQAKFNNQGLPDDHEDLPYGQWLLATGPACIVYDNYDQTDNSYLGWGDEGVGKNQYGKMLMTLRHEISRDPAPLEFERIFAEVLAARQVHGQQWKPLREYATPHPEINPLHFSQMAESAMHRGEAAECNALRAIIQQQTSKKCRELGPEIDTEKFSTRDLESTIIAKTTNPMPISVQPVDCLALAHFLYQQKQADDITVLNVANVTMGGGYAMGLGDYEGDLCRRTTLLHQLNHSHYAPDTGFGEDALFTPQVVALRGPAAHGYPFLADEMQFTVNVISSIPYNLNRKDAPKPDSAEYEQGMYQRIFNQLRLAANKQQKRLVLTAFGCGSRKNDAAFVARTYRDILHEHFQGVFTSVHFAILPKGAGMQNHYETFLHTFNAVDDFKFKPLSKKPGLQAEPIRDDAFSQALALPPTTVVRSIYIEEFAKTCLCFSDQTAARNFAAALIHDYGFSEQQVGLESACAYNRFLPRQPGEPPFLFAVTLPAKQADDLHYLLGFLFQHPSQKALTATVLKLLHAIHDYAKQAQTASTVSLGVFYSQQDLKKAKQEGLTLFLRKLLEGCSIAESIQALESSSHYAALRHGTFSNNAASLLKEFRVHSVEIPEAPSDSDSDHNNDDAATAPPGVQGRFVV